jgi:hypothetical protein
MWQSRRRTEVQGKRVIVLVDRLGLKILPPTASRSDVHLRSTRDYQPHGRA